MGTEFKIYTRTGDKGETSLIGGKRVPKFHQRIEAYGTVDELNSFVGLIRDQEIDPFERKTLIEIQDRLFTIESILASDTDNLTRKLPELFELDITFLENEIDRMNSFLPELKNFILPGGHPAVSLSHVARTICRRAERITLNLSTNYQVDHLVLKYLNRLSDYFFVLARYFSYYFKVDETAWIARI